MATIWINHTPFCEVCGEILGTEEADWGCFACGGDGFDDDECDDEFGYMPEDFIQPTIVPTKEKNDELP